MLGLECYNGNCIPGLAFRDEPWARLRRIQVCLSPFAFCEYLHLFRLVFPGHGAVSAEGIKVLTLLPKGWSGELLAGLV